MTLPGASHIQDPLRRRLDERALRMCTLSMQYARLGPSPEKDDVGPFIADCDPDIVTISDGTRAWINEAASTANALNPRRNYRLLVGRGFDRRVAILYDVNKVRMTGRVGPIKLKPVDVPRLRPNRHNIKRTEEEVAADFIEPFESAPVGAKFIMVGAATPIAPIEVQVIAVQFALMSRAAFRQRSGEAMALAAWLNENLGPDKTPTWNTIISGEFGAGPAAKEFEALVEIEGAMVGAFQRVNPLSRAALLAIPGRYEMDEEYGYVGAFLDSENLRAVLPDVAGAPPASREWLETTHALAPASLPVISTLPFRENELL